MNDANFVEIRNVCFDYRGRKIYHSVDIDIQRGKVTVIFGPSGSGKTTLLRLIGGQVKAGKGTVHVDGHNVAELSRKELLKLRARMGMLFQSGALFTDLSVFENVAFPLRVHTKLPESMLRDIVLMKLQAVGLRGARDLMPHELSGGMQRRVALARAIAFDPEMVMYDEPFAGQDPISKGVLVRLIRLLNDSLQITSVIVSHDIKVATSIADYMYLVAKPRGAESGKSAVITQHIYGDAAKPYVAQFKLRKDREGAWKVRNVTIEAINLGKIFREQFASEARKYDGDLDKVIDNWSSKTAAEEVEGVREGKDG